MKPIIALLAAPLLALAAIPAMLPAQPAPALQPAAHQRVLPLQGGRNFRDMGGYATSDGHHVRWGLLFRSGAMSGLTPADYAYLDRLDIKFVCDLRTGRERTAEPTVWGGAHKPDYWTSDTLSSGGDLGRLLAPGANVTGAQIRATMMDLYRTLPETHREAYRAIFRHLVDGQVPVAFNCSAGKDRTGVGAALILSALGVPRATVVEDYALSDKVVDFRKAFASQSNSPFAKLPDAVITPLLKSDPAYIEAMLDGVNARYGSVEGYLKTELGLTDADIARMRANLLE
ncbi:tyrosine-protein phosphatase [Flavisphingomonas formosensis]|uniref:tyrosine-protein phosphatase n=1 Tax=Flavisphingomonas formosensis TaxID=861534 RepID=UPI0012FB3AE2|nr:tyrosine-protein phosphatase [Sphingomonas formosensis]